MDVQVVFLVKGPIYLVCISCTEEPYESLRGQLELIYGQVGLHLPPSPFFWQSLEFLIWLIMIWLQMLLILTKSVNRCFEKNPKFDMTSLLGGTDAVFSSLIHSFSWFVSLFPNLFIFKPFKKLWMVRFEVSTFQRRTCTILENLIICIFIFLQLIRLHTVFIVLCYIGCKASDLSCTTVSFVSAL